MQSTATPEADRTPEVSPRIQHVVPWRVLAVSVLPDMRLHVTFVDGTSGEAHLQGFLNNEDVVGTVFEPLRDPGLFAQARVVTGAVEWPNGADLAPDAMYDSIKEHGVWILE